MGKGDSIDLALVTSFDLPPHCPDVVAEERWLDSRRRIARGKYSDPDSFLTARDSAQDKIK